MLVDHRAVIYDIAAVVCDINHRCVYVGKGQAQIGIGPAARGGETDAFIIQAVYDFGQVRRKFPFAV